MATTTPNYGWPVPTSTDYVKDGATAIEALGDAIDATVFGLPSAALALIKTQTVGTAVSSVTVTAAFNTTYDNYLIIFAGIGSSNTCDGKFTLNNSAGNTYAYSGNYQNYGNTNVLAGATGQPFINTWAATTTVAESISSFITIQNPFLAKRTTYQANYACPGFVGSYRGYDDNAVSHTAFTITPTAGTLTNGTISVYGFKK
jgi:hypothetical protein